MGMLTKEDLNQIGDLMDRKMDEKFVKFEDRIVGRIVEEVGEMLEVNVLPQFDRLENTLVTKDDLDRKLAPINGKINVLVDILHQNKSLSDDQRRIVHAS